MKKITVIILAVFFSAVVAAMGQHVDPGDNKVKQDQSELHNDIYLSYGTGTLYYFIDNEGLKGNTLSGTFLIGFSRSINKVIAVGFQLSYTNIGRSQPTYDYASYPPYQSYDEYMTDNLWQGMANVRFRYLNTPSFCMYSGVGMGVTMDYYHETNSMNTNDSKGQKLLPAGQLTLLGFRVGRAFSFFGEFGIGTNSILNAGFSYKFSD